MMNSKKMDSFRELFKTMEVLPYLSQHIFSLLLHVMNKKLLLTKNLDVQNHDIRSANTFHLHTTNLTKYQKEAHDTGIKVFDHLPTYIKCVANDI